MYLLLYFSSWVSRNPQHCRDPVTPLTWAVIIRNKNAISIVVTPLGRESLATVLRKQVGKVFIKKREREREREGRKEEEGVGGGGGGGERRKLLSNSDWKRGTSVFMIFVMCQRKCFSTHLSSEITRRYYLVMFWWRDYWILKAFE